MSVVPAVQDEAFEPVVLSAQAVLLRKLLVGFVLLVALVSVLVSVKVASALLVTGPIAGAGGVGACGVYAKGSRWCQSCWSHASCRRQRGCKRRW